MKRLFLKSLFFLLISLSVEGSNVINQYNLNDTFKKLEASFDGKIGLYAINTNNDEIVAYRGSQQFPIQSTAKIITVGAVLYESMRNSLLMQKKIYFHQRDLVSWSPITSLHVRSGMTIKELCHAAISYSDNTAVNLLINELGGMSKINEFAQQLGNNKFYLTNIEPSMNSNPKANEDYSTPKDMAKSLEKLLLTGFLGNKQQKQLLQWMHDNTTGDKRIRAGMPKGMFVADKTGTGSFGVANDIGLVWKQGCKPIVIAIYSVRNKSSDEPSDRMITNVSRSMFNYFESRDVCFQ